MDNIILFRGGYFYRFLDFWWILFIMANKNIHTHCKYIFEGFVTAIVYCTAHIRESYLKAHDSIGRKKLTFVTREYWIIYIGPGFLAAICLAPHPPLPPPSLVSTRDWRRIGILKERGEWCGRGAEKYDCQKAWSSKNDFNTLSMSPVRLKSRNC